MVPKLAIKKAAVCERVNDDTSSPKPVEAPTSNSEPSNRASSEPFIGTPNQNTIMVDKMAKLTAPIAK